MEQQLLNEVRELKSILLRIVGAQSDFPISDEVLDKAAKEFQKLFIDRGEWIQSHEIEKYIKSAPYDPGAFIRSEFGFTNCFKRGREYFYNKSDIIDLGKELKRRNVDLKRFMEYKEDLARFNKSIQEAAKNKGKRKKAYKLSTEVYDFTSDPPKLPDAAIIKADLESLKEEFFEARFGDYVDIYRGNHAMMKSIYWFQKYLEPGLKRSCQNWCEKFNYANNALERVTKKKEIFVPVQDEDMIQL